MSKSKYKRKLIAILSADVVGYSRLMGDNLPAEFTSVVDAVQSAVAIQNKLKKTK